MSYLTKLTVIKSTFVCLLNNMHMFSRKSVDFYKNIVKAVMKNKNAYFIAASK